MLPYRASCTRAFIVAPVCSNAIRVTCKYRVKKQQYHLYYQSEMETRTSNFPVNWQKKKKRKKKKMKKKKKEKINKKNKIESLKYLLFSSLYITLSYSLITPAGLFFSFSFPLLHLACRPDQARG